MIRKIKTTALLAMGILALASCNKDENKVYVTGSTPPVLTNTPLANTRLLVSDSAKTALTFSWSNPNYTFTTGVSSQDVTYYLQMDTTGANFSAPASMPISKELSMTLSTREFNTFFSLRDLLENIPHNVEFRVMAVLVNNSAPVYSNVIKMTVTPYLDVAVPIPDNGELWLTGNAVASGYSNPLVAPYVDNQKFKRVSAALYEITVNMVGGGGYKLIQKNGDWSTQYHMLSGGSWNAGSFEKKDADPPFAGPADAGSYKITVNFKTGKYTGVKL